jgi:RNA polymerase sigma-70 factor (ECF subfamily)
VTERLKEDSLQAAVSERAPQRPVGLEKLFVEHQSRVFKAAYRITGSLQDAEDVLQTVFLRLARWDEASLPQENLASYLYRSAVNAAFDQLRARQRAELVDLDSVGGSLSQDDAHGPERAHQGSEVRERLRRALGRLNTKHAEVFTLRYLEGYKNRDIARQLGLSRVTVAVVLHRVRHRLRKDLRQMKGTSR